MKPMSFIRVVLYYICNFAHLSNRDVKKAMQNECSHQFVGSLKNKAKAQNLTWPQVVDLDDDALQARIYEKVFNKITDKAEPNYDAVYQNNLLPKKRRKMRSQLYIEYRNQHGELALKPSQYHAKVRRHLKIRKASMRQFYRPAEILFIDYAGTQLKFSNNGKATFVHVFVACLGFSKKLFAFATPDMTTESWLAGLKAAFEYYGGVPEVVLCDNAKAMVTRAGSIPKMNEKALEFSRHFSFLFDTSRVGTPTDNGNAEAAVKFITMNILVSMNTDLTFFSLNEINQYLLKEVERLNNQPMKVIGVSRNALFDEQEKATLGELTPVCFDLFVKRRVVEVPKTYMVLHDGFYYSVPHDLRGEKVELVEREKSLTVVHKGKVKACIDLTDKSLRNKYLPEHMTPEHRAEANKNKDVYLAWASDIDTAVVDFIELLYSKTKNPHSRLVGKACAAIQKLYQSYDESDFIEACRYALAHGYDTYSELQLILRTRAFADCDEPNTVEHHHIRGKDYYEEQSHDH